MLHLAQRMNDIHPFRVMEVIDRAQALEKAGHDIIHMEVGEPDFPTAQPIIDAAKGFLDQGRVPYAPTAGLPALREALARFYQDRFSVNIAPERIIITPGASGALMLALAVTTNPGDEWLLPDPTYPCNRHFVRCFEGRVKLMPVNASSEFQPTAAMIGQAWTDATIGTIVASPANPSGTLLSQQALRQIHAEVAERRGLLIVDEIYQGLVYGQQPQTVLSFCNDAFVVNSFSKYFGMTGWRLGWLVVPESYADEVTKLAQHFFISSPVPAQHAALAALSPAALDIMEQRREELAKRRNCLLPELNRLGFKIAAVPEGAFYIYADCSALADNSDQLARRMIEEADIAVTPGRDFGDYCALQHLRFSYTARQSRLMEAMERLERMLRSA